jgi:hypothetical protein
MKVRFWGTRGSIAMPGPGTLRYGGNTACVEVRSAAGTLVVIDCGTGAHAHGRSLLTANSSPMRGRSRANHASASTLVVRLSCRAAPASAPSACSTAGRAS